MKYCSHCGEEIDEVIRKYQGWMLIYKCNSCKSAWEYTCGDALGGSTDFIQEINYFYAK